MLSQDSTLVDVALTVGAALGRHGIRAVLVGGSCAAVHTDGVYLSRDMDFIVQGSTTQEILDSAMADVGFQRNGDRYEHPAVHFYAEFPLGPLAIGGDHRIQPIAIGTPQGDVLLLSATDSCRDRLAAFYYWDDRQSLRLAATIACRRPVDFEVIADWSHAEGQTAKYTEFLKEREREAKRVG